MILNDRKIKQLLEKKELVIDPLDEKQIQPSSVDLRLGNDFLVYPEEIEILDVKNPDLGNQLKKVVCYTA